MSDWLITLTLTLTIFDNIILESKSGVYVDFHFGAQAARAGGPEDDLCEADFEGMDDLDETELAELEEGLAEASL